MKTSRNTIQAILLMAAMALSHNAAAQQISRDNTAQSLQPLQAHTVILQNHTAVVYYTQLSNGQYEIITTVGPNENVAGSAAQHRMTISTGQTYQLNLDSGVYGAPVTALKFQALPDALVFAGL